MYEISPSLTVDNIFRKITSYDIFKKYCPDFQRVGQAFKSPIRVDKNPSAFIIYYGGDLLFKDFGEGSYRAIDFVSRLFFTSFRETLQKINEDFGLGLEGGEVNDHLVSQSLEDIAHEKEIKVIKIKKRDWNTSDKEYWGTYGIGLHTVNLFDVVPISYFSINDYLTKADNIAYSYNYYWEKEVYRRKIYQPMSKVLKWVSNGGHVVQGEGVLPHAGNLLIITSSLKDVMTLYELGYTAIAPTSETVFVPEEYFLKQNKRFKRIVLFMDSDETGMKRNIELSKKWNLEYIFIPNENKTKDISDHAARYGLVESYKLVEFLLGKT